MRKRSAKSVLKRVNFKNFEKISDAFTDGSDLVSASKDTRKGQAATAPRKAPPTAGTPLLEWPSTPCARSRKAPPTAGTPPLEWALDVMRPVSKGNRDHAYRQHAAVVSQILNGGIIVSPCEVESWTKALY